MAIRIPSKGIDQNGSDKFVDKYYGRIPMYLKFIPETGATSLIYECNPEYIELFNGYIDGTIPKENISPELYLEIEKVVDHIQFFGLIPMPEYDPFFECAGYHPSPEGCKTFISKDSTYGCAVFYTADKSPLLLQ